MAAGRQWIRVAMRVRDEPGDLDWLEPARLERAGLVRLCRKLTGNADVAEDLAQEALLEAWRSRDALRNPDARRQWLAGIARNVCRRWWQRQGRERVHSAPASWDAEGQDPTETVDPGMDLERHELATLLDRAMALLPTGTRQALIARYVEERPYAEIAARLGLSDDAVSMRLTRGKLALRRILVTDLAVKAAAYGLRCPDEGTGWQETRLWCPFCGRRHWLIRFDDVDLRVAIRCPACTPDPALPLSAFPLMTGEFTQIIGGLRQPRAIANRTAVWAHGYFRGALHRRTVPCPTCRQPATVRLRLQQDTASLLTDPHVVLVHCDMCGEATNASFGGLVMALPEAQRFWRRHRRIRSLPAQEVETAGRPALVTTLVSVTDASRLAIVSARDTLAVMSVDGDRG